MHHAWKAGWGVVCAGVFMGYAAAAVAEDAAKSEIPERGKYLVAFGGCNDCHTPKIMSPEGPRPDVARLLSGFPESKKLPEIPKNVIGPVRWGAITTDDLTAWVGPWGTSFSANLTPDHETGLGHWTEEKFILAMRTGQHEGSGRPILPPMPWYGLAPLTDADLKAIFAYLRSIPPVKNRVPDPVPPVSEADETAMK
jgi:mono/diheme cytochrome c family protein